MRWSCSEPNVMNLQQEMRAMYRAARGKVFVHADKSQLELRVMAARAPDRELQRRLDSGDVYTADAIDWFQLPPGTTKKTLKPEARKASKIIHLGSQYHAGLRAVYQQCLRQDPSITYRMATALHAGFLKTYADTVSYWEAEHAQVLLQGYSEGAVLGGRRYYPQPPPVTETANYPIQRTAAEMMNLETIEVWKRLRKVVPTARLVFQLHDAVDVECYKRDVRQVISVLEDVMNNATYSILGRQHTFPIEVKVGEHWSDV
jgi:DNA polymerase I-like protein with 3'-5' exonuclease and polymerase domains